MIFLSAYLLPHHNEFYIPRVIFKWVYFLFMIFSISFKYDFKLLFELFASFGGFTDVFPY